ncbi:protein Mis18-alpha [Hoplias malabaricus]|uniref:protein Mis18-alpha n=1 Tax=Hoplias malabaricus TaxID=27720 RepID=UPI00346349B2
MAGKAGGGSSLADTFVVCESESESTVVRGGAAAEDEDAPAVFLCGKCRRPVGDSLSWAGSDEELNQILLKKVNDNVVIGKDPYMSCTPYEPGCVLLNIMCHGCGSTLGLMYTSTPKELDFKRSLYCFGVENIESYVLGSSDQQMAAVDSGGMPVTLEFQEIIEQQMTKIKSLAVTIGQRLLEVEMDIQSKSGTSVSCN